MSVVLITEALNTLEPVTELFRVDNLHAKPVEGDAEILRGLSITVNEGEVQVPKDRCLCALRVLDARTE